MYIYPINVCLSIKFGATKSMNIYLRLKVCVMWGKFSFLNKRIYWLCCTEIDDHLNLYNRNLKYQHLNPISWYKKKYVLTSFVNTKCVFCSWETGIKCWYLLFPYQPYVFKNLKFDFKTLVSINKKSFKLNSIYTFIIKRKL